MALKFDLTRDLEFERSNLKKKAANREWKDRLSGVGWNERDVSQWNVEPNVCPWALILTLDFQGQIMK